jgi:nitrite reductase (cytochrome c-552)
MPFKRVGAMKISDHHVRSPLLNVNRACQTCHGWSESEMTARVELIQTRTHDLRGVAMDALMELLTDLKAVRDRDGDTPAVVSSQAMQRKAQFLLDFVEAENSMGFHAPQEAMRLLGLSIDYTRQGQRALK